MTRGVFVMRNGKLVPKHLAGPRHSNAKMRQVISDDLGSDLEHHGFDDGRRTASKSTFRRWTKEAGLIEKGNDRERPRPLDGHSYARDLQSDVARSIEMLKQGYRPQYKYIRGD